MSELIVLDKERIGISSLYFDGDYVSNGHWMIDQDLIDFDVFKSMSDHPKKDQDDFYDTMYEDFMDNVESFELKLEYYRSGMYVDEILSFDKSMDKHIPDEGDLEHDFEVLPVLFSAGGSIRNFFGIRKEDLSKYFVVFTVDGKVRTLSFKYYEMIVSAGLKLVPNLKEEIIAGSDFTKEKNVQADPFGIYTGNKLIGCVASISGYDEKIYQVLKDIKKLDL